MDKLLTKYAERISVLGMHQTRRQYIPIVFATLVINTAIVLHHMDADGAKHLEQIAVTPEADSAIKRLKSRGLNVNQLDYSELNAQLESKRVISSNKTVE